MSELWTKGSEKLPEVNGDYLVIVGGPNYKVRFPEICGYSCEQEEFSCWDYYNDELCVYKQKDILCWMKIPEYNE